ncbi:signal peptidase I [Shimazuella kribbensis]|uniref:signal peptidase I n=1 Tax=Shimazuella kribbensis TaxID=139808 RepID=UPI0004048EA2|nr:signal peptidase I [Shimazuella kribbensis]
MRNLYKRKWIWISSALFLLIGITIFIRSLPIYEAEGTSMEPSIKEKEVYYAKTKDTYSRGDIVVFHSKEEGYDFIKRVVGLGGETIQIKNNQVYINGSKLIESYLKKSIDMEDTERVNIPQGHVFVLGDDRSNSYDSRQIGSISITDIIGFITP